MTIIKVPEKISSRVPNIIERIRSSKVQNVIYYMIDRKYRKVVNLRMWLKEQYKIALDSEELNAVASDLAGKSDDETMINVHRWVHDHTTYVTDDKKWNMTEKWEGVLNVFTTEKGDCESGALLIYILARLAGIPSKRLWIMCGGVKGGGHAWVGYIPQEYPFNFTFMDWCYWYKKYSIATRNKFTLSNQRILEYKNSGDEVESDYYKLWFVFNEDKSYREFR